MHLNHTPPNTCPIPTSASTSSHRLTAAAVFLRPLVGTNRLTDPSLTRKRNPSHLTSAADVGYSAAVLPEQHGHNELRVDKLCLIPSFNQRPFTLACYVSVNGLPSQLCLAHYCDTHGPTPLMVTEGLNNPCSVCFDRCPSTETHSLSAEHDLPRSCAPTSAPQTQSPTTALSDALSELHISRSASVPASAQDAQARRAALRCAASVGSEITATSLPPHEPISDCPRTAFSARRDSSFRRTYDETVTKKQGPCNNCAMTLPPQRVPVVMTNGLPPDLQKPTLRTQAPLEQVFRLAHQMSPAYSRSSSDSDGDREVRRYLRTRRAMHPLSSRTTSCSSTSTSSGRSVQHVHYVDYTSTHEPIRADSFSLVRASCLRALSFETLPRASSTMSPNSSPQSNHSPSFVTTQSPGSAATGGAIFFGDAVAGYTTAYIFRIPDLHARGHKRVYAFLALSRDRERLAMKTFAMISAAFRHLAIWIQHLAELEAERNRESSTFGSALHSGVWAPPPPPALPTFDLSTAAERGGSSFLTGGSGFSRRMGGPGGISSLKARGLAELVGQPDFFITLHGQFVKLLFEAGVVLNS